MSREYKIGSYRVAVEPATRYLGRESVPEFLRRQKRDCEDIVREIHTKANGEAWERVRNKIIIDHIGNETNETEKQGE